MKLSEFIEIQKRMLEKFGDHAVRCDTLPPQLVFTSDGVKCEFSVRTAFEGQFE